MDFFKNWIFFFFYDPIFWSVITQPGVMVLRILREGERFIIRAETYSCVSCACPFISNNDPTDNFTGRGRLIIVPKAHTWRISHLVLCTGIIRTNRPKGNTSGIWPEWKKKHRPTCPIIRVLFRDFLTFSNRVTHRSDE